MMSNSKKNRQIDANCANRRVINLAYIMSRNSADNR